jgi:parallel beta-helix repeat protein
MASLLQPGHGSLAVAAAATLVLLGALSCSSDPTDVTLPASPPTPSARKPRLTQLELTPSQASLQTGGTQQFAATGKMSDGSSVAINVIYTATGGTVTSAGRYTAGQAAGTYRVIATQSGGSLADTSKVTITASATPPVSSGPCSGIAVAAGASLQNAVNANGTGAVFCLGAGTFAHQTVQPKAGQRFIGARGSSGQRLSVLDGQGATYAFTGSSANVVIQGLVVKNYRPPLSDAAIFGYKGTGWLVIDNEITANAPGSGTNVWSGWIVRRNWIHHNGETGVVGSADGVGGVVDSNEISYNNLSGGKTNEGTTGGLKAVRQTNLVVRGNFVHHNVNKGVWCDYCNTGNIIRGNRVEDNTGIGIYLEVSHSATVDNNSVLRNGSSGRGGIWIDNSDHVEVASNTVRGPSPQGLILIRMVPHGVPASDRNLNNVYVHDNHVAAGASEYVGCVQFVSNSSYCGSSKANRFDRNAYTQPSSGAASFRWNDNNSIVRSAWRAAGQDPNGSFAP